MTESQLASLCQVNMSLCHAWTLQDALKTSTSPAGINAASVVGYGACVSELLRFKIPLLLGRVDFGFQVPYRPGKAANQFAATASELAYTGRQVTLDVSSCLLRCAYLKRV